MGMRMPETCWAVSKRQVIYLRSCCILLVDSVESVMMHGLANLKISRLMFLLIFFLCLYYCFVCLFSILCILCFCIVLRIVSPFVYSCLFPVCTVHVYRPLSRGGKPIAVNTSKYHIIIYHIIYHIIFVKKFISGMWWKILNHIWGKN